MIERSGPPSSSGQVREFTIHAVEAEIVMNAFGLHVHEGAMYVLDEDLENVQAIREAIKTYEEAIEEVFDAVEKTIESHTGIEGLERRVLDAIEETDGLSEVQLDEDAERFCDDLEDAYGKAVEGIAETIRHDEEDEEGYETEAEFRETVNEAAARYRDSVPAELNPLDDGFALVEGEPKSPSVLQPLVVRANEGDTIEIEFVNHLERHASIHQTSLPYDVETSDGMAVGRNPDTTAAPESAAPDNRVKYTWQAIDQGTHFFYDGANQAIDSATEPPQEANLLARGLFGAVVVEPAGATWTDPRTGGELRSGVRADVHEPSFMGNPEHGGTSYREFIIFYHSPVGTAPKLQWPGSDRQQSIHAINYRSDPSGQRINHDRPPDSHLEKLFYHSWTNGDPGGGDNVYTAYKGDPIKFCFVGASHEENHVHHLHQHRYKEVPRTNAPTIDAQTIGLGDTFEAYLTAAHGPRTVRPDMTFEDAFEVGAGYTHGTAGDVLFHCHLFPHYAEGMWGLMRVLDKERAFLEPLPETDIVDDSAFDRADLPLQDAVLSADSEVPGFPEFVGDAIEKENDVDDPIGHGAPTAPMLSVTNPREPTESEQGALGDEILPGAPYVDPCPEEPRRTIEYTIAVMEAQIAYNDAGEHDPEGIVYVLEKANVSPGPGRTAEDIAGVTDGEVILDDAERIRTGELNPEPMFLRANVGDCIKIRLRNELKTLEVAGEERTFDASIHPHYVGYDVLGSDSLPNAYNYYQGTKGDGDPNDVNEYRWYADEEGTIYFHDHIYAIMKGVNGMFCGLIVEPEGSEWRDPYSGEPVFSGAQANIVTPDDATTPDFREQALHYHDFAPLRDREGDLVNPEVEHMANKGTMAINYRNAPYYNRDGRHSTADNSDDGEDNHDGDDSHHGHDGDDGHDDALVDPAYVHSSAVHGDPPTPVIEAYESDPIRFRVFQGCYEEQHNFGVHGLRTTRRRLPTQDSVSKYLGTSEAFTFHVEPEASQFDGDHMTNPYNLPVRDYRYGSNVVDDLWCGMWGLVRIWGGAVDHLVSLPEHGSPNGRVSDERLREMGHPAPFADFDWTEEGQRAKQLYSLDDERTVTGVAADIADDLADRFVDEHLGGSDPVRDAERSVQQRLKDAGLYAPPRFPADTDARRNRSVGRSSLDAIRDREGPGSVAPDTAGLREFDVTAFRTEIPYNDYGDHDPHGVVFALDRHVEEIKAGRRAPEPVILHANEGERIRINLTNDIRGDLDDDHDHPEVLVEREWHRSDRISLHPLAFRFDVNGSNGATVGFNYDTTVGRDLTVTAEDAVAHGNTITYEWYADGEPGAVCLWDMADLRSTRHHGAYGLVIVHPAESIVLDNATAEPIDHGASSMVLPPEGDDFREHGLVFADSQFVVNRYDPSSCVVPRSFEQEDGGSPGEEEIEAILETPCNRTPEDTEDQGYGGVNYRSEPFARRFETDDAQHLVYSSEVHGDPNTPVIEANAGDPVRLQVACAGDKARAVTFHLAGHQWERFPGVDASPAIGTSGQFGPGTAHTLDLVDGAGSADGSGGDFVYQETKQRRRLESGLWGIFRVHDSTEAIGDGDTPLDTAQPLPDRAADVPLADRPGFVVRTGDVTGSGSADVVIGVPDSDIGAVDAGAVYVFVDTDPERISDLSSADLQVLNETANERAGTDVALTDRTGDGIADVVVETATERTVTVRGGQSLLDLVDSPPSSDVVESVRRSTTTDVTSIVPLDNAGDG